MAALIDQNGCGDLIPYRLGDGTVVHVRPICRADGDRLRRMFTRLSPTTIYLRFFSPVKQLHDSVVEHLTVVDHDRREALVALDGDEIVGVARYDGTSTPGEAEIAVTVEDAWQHRGLGKLLVSLLTREATGHGFDAFAASMLPDNRIALSMLHRLAPGSRATLAHGSYEATIDLRDSPRASAHRVRAIGDAVNEPQT
jgi:GNAT superfamily N-acetyltransferase